MKRKDGGGTAKNEISISRMLAELEMSASK